MGWSWTKKVKQFFFSVQRYLLERPAVHLAARGGAITQAAFDWLQK
jgi:hypothetical protein